MEFFTNTYELSITTHTHLDKKKRPVYEFRAATIAERRRETDTANHLDRLADPESGEDIEDPIEYIEAVLPHIKNRLLAVKVGKKTAPALMDLEETLDYTSIIELFWSMRNNEEFSVLLKKKLRSPLSSSMVESAKVATDAAEPLDNEAK